MAERSILALQSESTKRSYSRAVKAYEDFRGDQSHSESIVLAFLSKESESKAATTLWTYFSLVKKYLLLECNFDLGSATKIVDFLKTLSRLHVKKKATAFTLDDLNKFFRGSPSIGRDLVIKLIAMTGFYGGLRSSEIVVLCWTDVCFAEEGVLITIRKSKTDQAGVGATKLLPKLPDDALCPVFYYKKYKEEVKDLTGRLFKQYHNGKFINLPVGKQLVSDTPKHIALFLGLDNPHGYTGHALRVSSATVLADQGADILELKRHGRWASSAIAEEYVRESKHARLETASKLANTKLTLQSTNYMDNKSHQQASFGLTNCVFNGPVYFVNGQKEQGQ